MVIRKGIVIGIRVYQRTLSPDHGVCRYFFPRGICRFEPTCSEYAARAISQHGWYGVGMSIRRLSRCHPFSASGYDPVPSAQEIHNRKRIS